MKSSVTHLSFACMHDINKNLFILHMGYSEIFWVESQGSCCSSTTSGAVYQGCDESKTFQGIRNYENESFQSNFHIHKTLKPSSTVCFRVVWVFSFPKQIMPGFAGAIQEMEALLLSSCSVGAGIEGQKEGQGFVFSQFRITGWWSCLHLSGMKEAMNRGNIGQYLLLTFPSYDWQFRVRCTGKKGKRVCTQYPIIIRWFFHEYLIREGCPRGISNFPERYLI